ncbi:hypothetical protein [Acidovorax sp. SUPP1855]|uniref:hypothetical protein n=1 Tax=Acidovorax sp. SUPP1855 TaxID=431774 RepID=UPI0024E12208|nr:hypothetical protein [Acidovorax sp. SUPP1855]
MAFGVIHENRRATGQPRAFSHLKKQSGSSRNFTGSAPSFIKGSFTTKLVIAGRKQMVFNWQINRNQRLRHHPQKNIPAKIKKIVQHQAVSKNAIPILNFLGQ